MTFKLDMTPAEAKAKIIEYFSRDGAELSRSSGEFSVCYYRHPDDGRACAVGCLIPDEAYSKDFENNSVQELNGYWGELKYIDASGSLLSFLQRAQCLHDNAVTVKGFLDKLEKVLV